MKMGGSRTRRRVIKLGLTAGLVAIGGAVWARLSSIRLPAPGATELDEVARKLLYVIDRDGKQAIDQPRYVTREVADKLFEPSDVVFGYEQVNPVRVYPRKIMNFHEVVNDEIGGTAVTITYCPLTGSPMVFERPRMADGRPVRFGVSGLLYQSNLVMFDRETDSLWPQLIGAAVAGPFRGHVLAAAPMISTTWGRWRTAYQDTLCLAPPAGFPYPYNLDMYAGYELDSNLVYTAAPPAYHPKTFVVGVKRDQETLALLKDRVQSAQLLQNQVGEFRFAAAYDPVLDAVRVFDTRIDGRSVELSVRGEHLADHQGNRWNMRGQPVSGSDEALRPLASVDVFWFAWYAHYPRTRVLT